MSKTFRSLYADFLCNGMRLDSGHRFTFVSWSMWASLDKYASYYAFDDNKSWDLLNTYTMKG